MEAFLASVFGKPFNKQVDRIVRRREYLKDRLQLGSGSIFLCLNIGGSVSGTRRA